MNSKHRKILSGCIVFSLCIHIVALISFQRYSLWFSSSIKPEMIVPWLENVKKYERDQILKVAFEHRPNEKIKETAFHTPHPEAMQLLALRVSIHPPEPESPSFTLFQTSHPENDLKLIKPTLPTFFIPTSDFDLLAHLPKDLIIPSPEKNTRPHFYPLPIESTLTFSSKTPTIEQEIATPSVQFSEQIELPHTEELKPPKTPNMISLPLLPKIPTLDELETSSYSNFFDADLVFIERDDKKGFIFALTLIPRPDLDLPKINQHFTFLIDKANSIQQERLNATKIAVRKALEELTCQDTFNIIAFDNKIEKMAPQSLFCSKQTLQKAEEFLEKISLGSFFSTTDLFKPLFLTIPSQIESEELHTVILLTDGEIFSKKIGQHSILNEWTQMNGGKVALYIVGMNSDPYPMMLEAAATFNKGKFVSSPTNRGLKRKLIKLMKGIQTPIAKNMVCKAISFSPHAKIQFFPPKVPNLYLDQPLVILGETDNLDDFILFVQGRVKDRWLNIKKNISFVNARKGNRSLKQEWALQRAYDLYQSYLVDENPKFITEAQSLLEPFDIQAPFR